MGSKHLLMSLWQNAVSEGATFQCLFCAWSESSTILRVTELLGTAKHDKGYDFVSCLVTFVWVPFPFPFLLCEQSFCSSVITEFKSMVVCLLVITGGGYGGG